MSEPAVQIETPATGEYLAVVRAAATGLAAGLNFTYEQIDDLRIAVDEACAQLLAHRAGDGVLRVTYSVEDETLSVEVTVELADKDGTGPPDPLPKDSFSWQILRAVTDEVDERIDAGEVHLAFSKRGGAR
jgi:serine/threonine-protein kinase RsbW